MGKTTQQQVFSLEHIQSSNTVLQYGIGFRLMKCRQVGELCSVLRHISEDRCARAWEPWKYAADVMVIIDPLHASTSPWRRFAVWRSVVSPMKQRNIPTERTGIIGLGRRPAAKSAQNESDAAQGRPIEWSFNRQLRHFGAVLCMQLRQFTVEFTARSEIQKCHSTTGVNSVLTCRLCGSCVVATCSGVRSCW